jgi:hypothetical protein
MRGSYYMGNPGVSVQSTIRDFDPKPAVSGVSQTTSIAGVRRTNLAAVNYDEATFELQFLDNSARLVTPVTGAGTTYAAAAATEDGLTEYRHAMDFWHDANSVASQGWKDGRPVQFFLTSPTIALSAAPPAPTATDYSTWVFDAPVCERWPGVKARPPKTTLYNVTLPAIEYKAP